MTLTAQKLKATVVLDGRQLLGIKAPHGDGTRVRLSIDVAGRTLTGNIAAKSLRKAQATIRELGAEHVVVMLQGNLVADTIAVAGLAVQPKTPKAVKAPEPAQASAPETAPTVTPEPRRLGLADLRAAALARKRAAA
jgi:hypothetical protein